MSLENRRSEVPEQLTLLVDELLDAHEDTVRLAAGLVVDWRWQAHLCYLRELGRLGREALASASDPRRRSQAIPSENGIAGRLQSRQTTHWAGDLWQFRPNTVRRGDWRCARDGDGESPA
jgi:hypothetical protein